MVMNTDLQKLEPGNLVRLYEIDGSAFGAEILRFHSDTLAHTPEEIAAAGGDESKLPPKSIWWQGIEYSAWPSQNEGIETSTDGSSAQPKLSVANLNGSITALCLAYDDMLQARVTIHDTFAHYLDARNFSGGNPSADPTQEKLQVYYIDSKSAETNQTVEFKLSSPMDLQGIQLPRRQLHAICTWAMNGWYRTGNGCSYSGTAYFDKFNNPVDDPSKDVCPGTLSGCKCRFGANNELDHGGFPGTSLLKR